MSELHQIAAVQHPEFDREARLAALTGLIDRAEREAASLGAPDCAICLQLARVALQSRMRQD